MNNKFSKLSLTFILFLSIQTAFTQEDFTSKISFLQGNNTTQVTHKTETVFLERKPFSIKFFNKKYNSDKSLFYSMQVSILANPADTLILTSEKKIDKIPYFEPGTGMAPGYSNMYDTIFITNEGHHYITYENEADKRANLISEKNGMHELEWKLLVANYQEKEVPFDLLKLNTLYFVFLNNKNLNGKIEKDELQIVIVNFK